MTSSHTANEAAGRVADTAGQAADQVAGTTTQAASQVAGTARQQAGMVAGEAVNQAQQLMDQAQQEISTQAAQQTQRMGSNLRDVARNLSSMADSGQPGSTAQTVVRRMAEAGDQVAGYLEGTHPSDMVADLQRIGRRRPGAFLLGAALAGFAVGRLANAARKATASQGTSAQHRPTAAGARPLPGVPTGEAVIDLTYPAAAGEATGTGYPEGYLPGRGGAL